MNKISTIASLMVTIGANSSGLRKELRASQRQLNRAFGPEAMAASNATVERAGELMSVLVVGMGVVGVKAVKMAAGLEQSKIAFETMLGSAQAANTFLQQLQDFTEKTPFTFDGLVAGSKRMLAMGFTVQEIIPTMTTLGDAVAAVGGSSEALDNVILAFSQMKAKGMVSAQEMNSLADNGLPAWEMLAKAIGTDIPTAMDLAEKKSIDTNSAISGMLSQMSTKYGGMMQKQSNTITGILSNIQDKASATMRQVGEDIVAAFDLKTATNNALNTLTEFSGKVKSLGIGGAMVDMVPASVEVGLLATAGAMTAKMVPALYEMALAETAVGIALGPLMGIGALVAVALGTIIYQSGKATTETNDMTIALYAGADGMNAVSMYANNLSGNFIDVGNAANYAAKQMAVFNHMADYRRSEDTNTLPPIITTSPPVIPEIPSGGGGSGVDEASKAYEDLQEKAKRASESIEDEWIQLTNTQLEQLDKWKTDELKTLDESQSVNENYQRDLGRLDEIYAEKKKKILLDQQKEQNSIWDETYNSAKSLQDRIAKLNLSTVTNSSGGTETSSVASRKLDIESDYSTQIENIKEKYRDLALKFQSADADTQANYKRIWAENGLLFETTADSMVSFNQQSNNEMVVADRERISKLKALNADYAEWKEKLDSAYNAGNIQASMIAINSQQSLLQQDLDGRQAIIDLYYENWKTTHETAMMQMAGILSDTQGSFKTFFSDILTAASTPLEALQDLFLNVWSNIVNSFAEKWSAGITNNIMSSLGLLSDDNTGGVDAAKWAAKTAAATTYYTAQTAAAVASQTAISAAALTTTATMTATSVAAGAAIAAAYAPAAAMVSLATLGANSAPAMAGIAATTALASSLSVAGLATGGVVTGVGGPTSDNQLRWLSPGEYVINAAASKALGLDTLNTLNTGQLPGYATGGLVTGPSLSSLSSRYSSSAVSADVNKNSNANTQGAVVHQHNWNITAWDGKSVDKAIRNGLGKKVAKFFEAQAAAFEGGTV